MSIELMNGASYSYVRESDNLSLNFFEQWTELSNTPGKTMSDLNLKAVSYEQVSVVVRKS